MISRGWCRIVDRVWRGGLSSRSAGCGIGSGASRVAGALGRIGRVTVINLPTLSFVSATSRAPPAGIGFILEFRLRGRGDINKGSGGWSWFICVAYFGRGATRAI